MEITAEDKSEIVVEDKSLNSRSIFVREITSEKEYVYNPPSDDFHMNTLLLKRATLHKDADSSETILLEMETKTDTGEVVSFPLLYLGGPKDPSSASLDLTVISDSKFRVAKGKGPIYLIGEFVQEWKDEASEDGDVEDEEEGEELAEEMNGDVSDKENESVNVTLGKRQPVTTGSKRKHEGADDAGAKKQRVSDADKKGKEADEAMDDAKASS